MQEFQLDMSKYTMEVLTKSGNMERVMSFVELCVNDIGNPRTSTQLTIVGEELAYNIFSYAYDEVPGEFVLKIILHPEQNKVIMEFRDTGKPYNPLKYEEPNMETPVSERTIGGVGIALAKKLTDNQIYRYENQQNVLIVEKYIDIS